MIEYYIYNTTYIAQVASFGPLNCLLFKKDKHYKWKIHYIC